MLKPSRRAVVVAASFALACASVAPAAHAERSGSDPDSDEQSDGLLSGLLDLVDVTGLLGDLPVLGEMGGVPAVGGLGLPALDELPTVEGIGLPTLEGLGLPAVEGLGLDDVLSDGGIGGFDTPLPLGDPLGILDVLSVSGLNLNVLAEVGLTGAVSLL